MAEQLRVCYSVSERRSCAVLTLGRSTYRYQSVAYEQAALRNRLKVLVDTQMRLFREFGDWYQR